MLKKIRPFARIEEPEKLAEIVAAGRMRSYPRYSSLFREGSRSNTLVLILRGQVASRTHMQPGVEELHGPGAYFGAEALAFGVMRRDASVQVIEECRVWTLRSDDLTDLEVDLLEFKAHALAAVQPARVYITDRFENTGQVFTGSNRKSIEHGIVLNMASPPLLQLLVGHLGDPAGPRLILLPAVQLQLSSSGSVF